MYQDRDGFWNQDYAGESYACAALNAQVIMEMRKNARTPRRQRTRIRDIVRQLAGPGYIFPRKRATGQ